MSSKTYTLCEHEHIVIHPNGGHSEQDGLLEIPADEFESIEAFILSNENQFLVPSYKKGFKRSLKAQQYVGTIQTKKGLTIEILPKIAKVNNKDSAKETLVKMLRYLKDSPFKEFNKTNLETQKMHLLDIYISMFCQELESLLKKGFRSDYVKHENNLNYLKGKLLFSQNIKYNLTDKSKFFVSYDEYSQNRSENRLIKSTLLYLKDKTSNFQNQQHIRQLLFAMETIPLSSNINRDFAVCKGNRLMKDYKNILIWCGLFLNTESFIPFQGSNIAFAILFDMNKVFEDYVTRQLRLELSGFIVHPQDQRHYLFEELSIYKLKPDIFLEREDACIVVDTKWKLINNERDVSQADLYQMYAYLNKYEKTNDAIIIFPQNGNACERSYYYYYDKNKSQKAHIFFLNLENNNLSDIEDVILNCNLKTSNNPIKS